LSTRRWLKGLCLFALAISAGAESVSAQDSVSTADSLIGQDSVRTQNGLPPQDSVNAANNQPIARCDTTNAVDRVIAVVAMHR